MGREDLEKKQARSDDWVTRRYNQKSRFIHYWHQIDEIASCGAARVLEVGPGCGLVAWYLRRVRGLDVVTLDIDAGGAADVVGSVFALPFGPESFDAVLCADVLDHYPIAMFRQAAEEACRVSRRWWIVSLPSRAKWFRLSGRLPLVGQFDFFWALAAGHSGRREGGAPASDKESHPDDGKHFWRLGQRGVRLADFHRLAEGAGFALSREFRPPDAPRHHIVVYSKGGPGQPTPVAGA